MNIHPEVYNDSKSNFNFDLG